MILYIKQKVFSWGDKYSIYDANQREVYKAWGEILSLGAKIHVGYADGREIAYVKQKLMKAMPTYEIYLEGELFASMRQRFTFLKKKIVVTSEYGEFVIDGSFWDHDYTVTRDGNLIGSVSKSWLTWGDVYELDVYNEEYVVIFVAMVLGVDSILAQERR